MFSFWILWNNARNLNYIKKFNPRKAIRLADNKQKTKNFLWERGIPFAETYALIKSRKELADFDFHTLENKNFVVKPNHGSKGRWISIVSYQGEQEWDNPIKKGFQYFFTPQSKRKKSKKSLQHIFRIWGELMSEHELKLQLATILDGEFSITTQDTILVEEKLIPGSGFKDFCQYGLADIRIIVFNLVPVAAMIRIPTEKSGGKANIAAGWIGCWIDIKTGKIFSTLAHGKIYKQTFPKESKIFQGKKIPFWDDLLFYSSKIQYFVNLWYLALDWVITEDGPKLLEINARAGLEVQKISDVRLKNVLHKIEDLHIQEPQKGVEIAQTLFWQEKTRRESFHKILYLYQMGKLNIKDGNATEEIDIEVKVDLNKKHNYISPELYARIQQTEQSLHIELPENSILLRQLDFLPSDKLQNSIILGRSVAENFLIKPQKKQQSLVNIIKPEMMIESEFAALHQLDDKIDLLHKRLNLTAKLRPQNYLNELDNFITWKGSYSPIFSYNFPDTKRMYQWKDELLQIKESCNHWSLKSPLVKLFNEKVDELLIRHQLLDAYIKQDISGIEEGNRLLWWEFDEDLVKLSKEKLGEIEDKESLGKTLGFTEVREKIEKRLNELEIFGVEIIENSSNFARISITMGKEVKVNISQGVEFREKEIDSVIAHEIDTHLLRYMNGKKSGWKIFSSGTGFYLKDEEGLAIWNAKQKLPENYESLGIYKKYYLLYESMGLNFRQLFDLVNVVYPNYSFEGKFKACIRIKKGIIHNSIRQKGWSWMKNKVYLEGYEGMFDKEIDQSMYLGKIKLKDSEFIR